MSSNSNVRYSWLSKVVEPEAKLDTDAVRQRYEGKEDHRGTSTVKGDRPALNDDGSDKSGFVDEQLAATKLQAVARGRRTRRQLVQEEEQDIGLNDGSPSAPVQAADSHTDDDGDSSNFDVQHVLQKFYRTNAPEDVDNVAKVVEIVGDSAVRTCSHASLPRAR